jgi:hypothetical protein
LKDYGTGERLRYCMHGRLIDLLYRLRFLDEPQTTSSLNSSKVTCDLFVPIRCLVAAAAPALIKAGPMVRRNNSTYHLMLSTRQAIALMKSWKQGAITQAATVWERMAQFADIEAM